MVAREFGDVKLTVNEENLGFSAANNLAIRAGDAPYLLALNPDTRVTDGRRSVAFAGEDASVIWMSRAGSPKAILSFSGHLFRRRR